MIRPYSPAVTVRRVTWRCCGAVLRDYTGTRPRLEVTLPEERWPGYKPLRPLHMEQGDSYQELRYIPHKNTVESRAARQKPLVFDADNRPLSLSRLAAPVGRGAKLPTVVQCRKSGKVMRLTLISGSGDAGLDSRALQALARVPAMNCRKSRRSLRFTGREPPERRVENDRNEFRGCVVRLFPAVADFSGDPVVAGAFPGQEL